MYRRVMAFDFDGTLAVEGRVPPEVEAALEQCRAGGHVLFLVTGRRFETVALGSLGDLFTGIVWENGAVLTHAASGETYLPFGQLDARLLKAIEEAGIPFERGLAIAANVNIERSFSASPKAARFLGESPHRVRSRSRPVPFVAPGGRTITAFLLYSIEVLPPWALRMSQWPSQTPFPP